MELALADIMNNQSILQDIKLDVLQNNDGCHLDAVMRTFINYYVDYKELLGVLGPPCSETVEPVASELITFWRNTHMCLCVCGALESINPMPRMCFGITISSSRPRTLNDVSTHTQ